MDQRRTDFSLTKSFLLPSLKMFIKAAEELQQFDDQTMERLKYFEANFVRLLEDVYVTTENKKYLSLSHGDFHRKNMLFKHENGKLVDMFLVRYLKILE